MNSERRNPTAIYYNTESVIKESTRLVKQALSMQSSEIVAAIQKGIKVLTHILESEKSVSDIHIRTDRHIVINYSGGLKKIEQFDRLSMSDVLGILLALYRSRSGARTQDDENENNRDDKEFLHRLSIELSEDFSCEGGDVLGSVLPIGRLRVQAFFDDTGIGVTARRLNDSIPNLQELQFDKDTIYAMMQMATMRSGLCLVTGQTGTGKSTTLAALMKWVVEETQRHIVTIEDPIEYRFSDTKDSGDLIQGIVTQQEVNKDVRSYSHGLKTALRKAPHIIVIGEIRDEDTMTTAISAAQTGHLVFGTLHTRGASATIARIIDFFPSDRIGPVLNQLAEILRFILSQGLLLSARDPGGRRVLCYEFLRNTCEASKSAIRKYGESSTALEDLLYRQENTKWDDCLESLFNRGEIALTTRDANYMRKLTEEK